MSNKVIDFPQFRKLSNDKVFYRINSEKHFDEIQLIGTSAKMYTIIAHQYPELVRIMDMLDVNSKTYLSSNKNEFESLLNNYSL